MLLLPTKTQIFEWNNPQRKRLLGPSLYFKEEETVAKRIKRLLSVWQLSISLIFFFYDKAYSSSIKLIILLLMFLNWQIESLKPSFLQPSRNFTSTSLMLTWGRTKRMPSGLKGQVKHLDGSSPGVWEARLPGSHLIEEQRKGTQGTSVRSLKKSENLMLSNFFSLVFFWNA